MRLERELERYARDTIAATGVGEMRKFTSPGRRGPPDNLGLWTGARCDFLEFKQRDEKPGRQQLDWHRLLQRLGFEVWILDTKEKIDGYIGLRCAERLHAASLPDAGA